MMMMSVVTFFPWSGSFHFCLVFACFGTFCRLCFGIRNFDTRRSTSSCNCHQFVHDTASNLQTLVVIGTVYPNIPLSSASIHSHPRSSLGATLGVCMSVTAYGNLSTMSSVWPIGASRLNLRPRPLSI